MVIGIVIAVAGWSQVACGAPVRRWHRGRWKATPWGTCDVPLSELRKDCAEDPLVPRVPSLPGVLRLRPAGGPATDADQYSVMVD